ncbi:MAG TPA: hypothetical protein VGO49_17120 [Bradyrhizobium sp.]|jgi:hypothetical protein|nr:hypothetical protein [Bradyrhizobium sp.]
MAKQPGGNIFDYKTYKNDRGRTPINDVECATLFFDVVEFSKNNVNEEMIDIVDTMQDRMFKLLDPKYYWAEREDYSVNNGLVLLPTGDGYGISLNNREKDEVILDLAADLHMTFSRIGRFQFRMGIAKGRNLVTLDLNGNVNVFGYGVVRATRVCNAARPKQILVDSVFANSLLQKSRSFPLTPIETEFETKHGEKFKCHNYAQSNFGIEV